MRNLTLAFALAGALLLGGCPGGGGSGKLPSFSEEELAKDPAPNFTLGVAKLKSPDKTGAIDYAAAYAFFAKSAELGGGAKAQFNAGWAAERLGQLSAAETHYRAAVDANPKYERAVISLARVLQENGKAPQAVALFESFVKESPDSAEARNDLIASLVEAKLYDRALEEAQEILRRDPTNAKVYRNLSAMYYKQGNYSMSQLCAEKALQLKADDAGTYNNMGVTLLIQGDEAEAISRFKEAIAIEGDNLPANLNLGWIALNSGDYQLANASFEAAVKADPKDLDAKMGLAIAKRGLGDFKTAGLIYDEIIAANKKHLTVYRNAATLNELYIKDYARAIKYLEAHVAVHGASNSADAIAQMEQVKAAQAAEAERKRVEAERKKAEEERKRRNEEVLAKIAGVITSTKSKLSAAESCLEPDKTEEITMMLETAQQVVDAQDTDMAADVQTMLEGYVTDVDEAAAACAGGGAPAPAEEGAEEAAPTE